MEIEPHGGHDVEAGANHIDSRKLDGHGDATMIALDRTLPLLATQYGFQVKRLI
jgi:hypothetical protein